MSPRFLADDDGGLSRLWETVALGVRFTVALEKDTLQVFTWGNGERGSLGLGDNQNRTSPEKVDAFTRVGVRRHAAPVELCGHVAPVLLVGALLPLYCAGSLLGGTLLRRSLTPNGKIQP